MTGDDAAAQLRFAANRLLSNNAELSFAAETVISIAVTVADGDTIRAVKLLENVETFTAAAVEEMRSRGIRQSFLDRWADRLPVGRKLNHGSSRSSS